MGTGIAISIRVGQYLGAGDGLGAKSACRVAFTIICMCYIVPYNLYIKLKLQFWDMRKTHTKNITGIYDMSELYEVCWSHTLLCIILLVGFTAIVTAVLIATLKDYIPRVFTNVEWVPYLFDQFCLALL